MTSLILGMDFMKSIYNVTAILKYRKKNTLHACRYKVNTMSQVTKTDFMNKLHDVLNTEKNTHHCVQSSHYSSIQVLSSKDREKQKIKSKFNYKSQVTNYYALNSVKVKTRRGSINRSWKKPSLLINNHQILRLKYHL